MNRLDKDRAWIEYTCRRRAYGKRSEIDFKDALETLKTYFQGHPMYVYSDSNRIFDGFTQALGVPCSNLRYEENIDMFLKSGHQHYVILETGERSSKQVHRFERCTSQINWNNMNILQAWRISEFV